MTGHLPSCRPGDVERVLIKSGFVENRQRGSHKVFVRPADGRMAVVPCHGRDLKRGTLHAILKGAGITPKEFTARL